MKTLNETTGFYETLLYDENGTLLGKIVHLITESPPERASIYYNTEEMFQKELANERRERINDEIIVSAKAKRARRARGTSKRGDNGV